MDGNASDDNDDFFNPEEEVEISSSNKVNKQKIQKNIKIQIK